MFCYSNNGLSMRAVDDDYKAKKGEKLFADYATPEQLAEAFPDYGSEASKIDTLNQIYALEDTITPRRRDEAILGQDDGWLENTRAQIAALRAQL
jgi:hypothetical protein